MATILREGKIHKRMAWFTTCSTCGSEIKMLQGDPLATEEVCYNCDASQYYVRYICPVCGSKKKAFTDSSFGVKGNATYKEVTLEEEDREDMRSWENIKADLSDDDRAWISNRFRV